MVGLIHKHWQCNLSIVIKSPVRFIIMEFKAQSIDITNFESELDTFKSAFTKNREIASKRFKLAIQNPSKIG